MSSAPWAEGQIAHFGFVVPDLDQAVRELSTRWRLSFVPTLDADLTVRVRGVPEIHHLTSMWSQEGPPHIELIQEVRDSPWRAHAGLDHVGYWLESSDLSAQLALMDENLVEVRSETGAPIQFVYLEDPVLGRIELVDVRRRASIEEALRRPRGG